MPFLKNWLDIKPPSELHLLDIALFLSLLPHLFLLKTAMLFYLFLAAVLTFFGSPARWKLYLLTLMGVLAILLSFFHDYNFANFSRFAFFVSLVSALLLVAVSLQRLSREVNLYLRISPPLLMLLAFFFFNSIMMLFYALGVLFVFVLLSVWHRMRSPLHEALRSTGMLFFLALPMVALLFAVFPRISFKKTNFGFKEEHLVRTGHDGTMYLDEKALLVPSKRVVMEVFFDNTIPKAENLYFRGSVLYREVAGRWLGLLDKHNSAKHYPLAVQTHLSRYQVTLYPHHQEWLYMLDMPLYAPAMSYVGSDYCVRHEKPVMQTLRYEGVSALVYETDTDEEPPKAAGEVDRERDPKTAAWMHQIASQTQSSEAKAQKIMAFFKSLKLHYSLRPEPFDAEHPIDSFLFGTKSGYCVHFASAFANAARMAGIPSRIVTGFKPSGDEVVKNYLVIRESDAHAWVELFIEGKGWMRYEPTSAALFAPRGVNGEAGAVQQTDKGQIEGFFKEVNLYYMYTKYLINAWVLDYNRLKQKQIIQAIKSNLIVLIKIIGGFITLALVSILLFVLLRRRRCKSALMCEVEKLYGMLQRHGLVKETSETMEHFLARALSAEPTLIELKRIDRLYHRIRYADETALLNEFSISLRRLGEQSKLV